MDKKEKLFVDVDNSTIIGSYSKPSVQIAVCHGEYASEIVKRYNKYTELIEKVADLEDRLRAALMKPQWDRRQK